MHQITHWNHLVFIIVLALAATACTGQTSGVSEPSTSVVSTTADPSVASSTTSAPTSTSITTTGPSIRGYHRLIDGGLGVLLLGGFRAPGPPNSETLAPDPAWVFDVGDGWSNLGHNRLPPLQEAVYDAGSEVVVVLMPNNPLLVPDLTGPTTWHYDQGSGEATQMGRGGPEGVIGTRAAYDAESDRVITYGGWSPESGESDQTWAYDVDSDTWTEMSPDFSPPGRNFHEMAYDITGDRVILFGGSRGADTLADIWAYDYNANTWTDLSTDGPAGRAYSSMSYDPTRNRLVLFGGTEGLAEVPMDDTWEFALGSDTWNEVVTAEAPGARGWHAMTYDNSSELIILFGGGPTRSDYTAETWTFDPSNNIWTEAT